MSGGGYTATTEALSTAAKTIGDLAEHLLDDNPDLQTPQVTAEKFGRAHGAHATKYTAGAQALWAAVSGYSSTLGSFGTNLGTAGSSYSTNEGNQAGVITDAGGSL
ncbi:hypothetical protein [Amycolatopsis vancoresmycina]|uniref:Uncharacterized protein n=1 Tax=Amycolatopsis vancoresmycina DSM 44592 TaxID=1292037 RepID=R1HND0_9PSEU|nr:hypothetical protein [Amycolatopsis vancoresmycina]EOD65010.1 hypothetical protein H480_28846 [Amycolatopsis vancoresmycina DSM 44592]